MDNLAERLDLLLDLDSRHDELLKSIDDLDKKVEKVLAVWLTAGSQADPPQAANN
jgi:hypothetical protein